MQRCWNHRFLNLLDKLPKKLQGQAKLMLKPIPYAATKQEAERLKGVFQAWCRKRGCEEAARLIDLDWDQMVTFYHFPKEQWLHLRASNPVESPFSAVRPRTDAARRYQKTRTASALIWKTLMFISNHPERSHWEAEWIFPPTGTPVGIALDGDESGPRPEARQWHLKLPSQFRWIIERARPELANVLRSWLDQYLPEDVFSVVKLSGFGVEDPQGEPLRWDVSFETTGDKWLGITIPFVGDNPEEAIVDT